MSEKHWKKLTDEQAITLARKANCEEAALALVSDESTRPEALLQQLIEKQFWPDGVRLMAHALPVREAVWWGCLCVRSAFGEQLADADSQLLAVAEQYVYKPTEANSQAAYHQAQVKPTQHAAQLLAMAAGFAGGKVRVNEQQQVDVGTDSCAPMISGAVMIAATAREPEGIPDMYQRMLRSAVQIAEGESGRDAFAGDSR